jgi:hypothetical protein
MHVMFISELLVQTMEIPEEMRIPDPKGTET